MSRHASARLFVAIDPPDQVRQALAAWARTALRQAGARAGTGPPGTGGARSRAGRSGAGQPLRVLGPETLHVTLCFLGDQPVGEIQAIADQMASVAAEAGELTVGAPLWLPPRRPRALAVELHEDTGRLGALHRRLLGALSDICDLDGHGRGAGRSRGGRGAGADHGGGDVAGGRRRRFRPHVTVARMRHGAAPRERMLAPTPPLSFTPRELVLYRSWLSPSGASYEAIGRCPL